jgi:ABC-type amino acid transport substrate-binding protein
MSLLNIFKNYWFDKLTELSGLKFFLKFWSNKVIKIILTIFKIIIFLVVSLPSFSQESSVLNLVSPHFPPYTYEHNNEIKGIGPDVIKRVFANTNIPYKITMVKDYAEAVQIIKTKLGDGMFLASQNAERNAIAVFTQPLVINKWSWFMLKNANVDLKSETFKLKAVIGSLKGTNTYKWLKENGYSNVASPVDALSLVSMLKSNRIDAAFLADAVFEYGLDNKALSQFEKVLEVEKAFGMYISHDYLKKHPDSLDQINNSIKKVVNTL